MLWVALHFPGLSGEALAPLAGWACQFTPKVALAPPDALLAEVQASLRYFGGEQDFLDELRAGLAALGMTASLAVAPTGLAALWRARGGGGRLAVRILKRRGVPLSAPLRIPVERPASPRPAHALGRASLPRPAGDDARAARRVGLPVHA